MPGFRSWDCIPAGVRPGCCNALWVRRWRVRPCCSACASTPNRRCGTDWRSALPTTPSLRRWSWPRAPRPPPGGGAGDQGHDASHGQPGLVGHRATRTRHADRARAAGALDPIAPIRKQIGRGKTQVTNRDTYARYTTRRAASPWCKFRGARRAIGPAAPSRVTRSNPSARRRTAPPGRRRRHGGRTHRSVSLSTARQPHRRRRPGAV